MPSPVVSRPLSTHFVGKPYKCPAVVLEDVWIKVEEGQQKSKRPYRALIDTGTSCTFFPIELTGELLFPNVTELNLRGPLDEALSKWDGFQFTVSHAEFGDVDVFGVPANCAGIILGRDFLSGIDGYSGQRLGDPWKLLADYCSNQWTLSRCV